MSHARHADHLLRRRDRHGRQHLPRRPQRRAHADAVDRRPQRRLLARRCRSASTRRSSRPGLRLPGGQRRGPGAHARLAAQLDAAPDRLRKRYPAFGRGTIEFLHPGTAGCWPTCASSRARRSCASPTSRASRSPWSSTCRASTGACRSRSSAGSTSRRSASCRTCSTARSRTTSTGCELTDGGLTV